MKTTVIAVSFFPSSSHLLPFIALTLTLPSSSPPPPFHRPYPNPPFLPPPLPSATEPPSPPSNLQIIASGPRVVMVQWELPQIVNTKSNYTIVCTLTSTGDIAYNTGETRTSINVLPSTNYSCSVVAINEFGASLPAVSDVATPAKSSNN